MSPRQFRNQKLPGIVRDLIATSNIPAKHIKLEVTENFLLKDTHEVKKQLTELRDIGVGLSLDDFGTGYSSLVALKRFPFTTVKIDKTFVDDIESDEEERLLCSAAISMGRSLKLSTVIEGVETKEQLEFVREHGCDFIQGYLTGKPMKEENLYSILAKQT